ncbi:replicative DNA helicase (plasmid) [Stanieria cyanosphaera PCC 7437]|uniref:Replicative DNA helicase n=1 Tax=Stanieria cyanosphaera (strain ATCC 29371 / PCC 7437) TaxID=111780 RepID=K9XZR3_STAC7|nr:replicative DNA helicase [Stanieria cyanosphaera]AFZ36904.1 replicative DNA helicase [Stanieria cyanosphaera PCC 7437]AFZ37335.1 replicative DNA helicase [Stanieria cyanosphaera PCC 7437]AFZ37539.1 replicative DNA helicase [Stanieria cyanosphaera PCC 7437]AFZ38014.1 replicative DNA helicase [Stanieria cyanosphaera PCC 7437]
MNDNHLPPTNIEAEEAILGGILLDPKAITIVADILPVEAFSISTHQQIYKAALLLHHKDKQVDLMTVSTWLSDHKLLEKVGGTTKLAQLLNRTVSAVNIDRYSLLVLDKYQRRRLIAAGHEIVDLGYDTAIELETVFDFAESKLFALTTDKKDKFTTEPINDCLADIFNELEQGSLPLFSTGLTDLDSLIGGLTKQDLIIVAARPSMGKSWFACYLANHIAIKEKKPVVFFSAEMSRKQLTKRFLAMHTGIDSQRLMNNVIYEDEMDSLVNGLSNLAELPIEINDTPAEQLTPAKIRSELRKIQSKRGELGLVVLDYIQKLGDRAAGNRAQVIGKYSGACKDIAKQFNVPFVVLAQINRGVESQSNKRPAMASLKDSGDIEQDGDLLLMLYRDEYYKSDTEDNGVMEVIVGKNRNGATGTCKVLFDPSVGAFCDYTS